VLPLGFAAFLVFGVGLVLVGANQADLARDLDLDLARSGLLVSALALGVGVGVVATGPLADRHPGRPLFVGASLVGALALLLVDAGMGFARAFLHVLLLGVGMGAYEALLNAAIGRRYGARAAKPITLVHAAATLGAMLGPPAIGWVAAHFHWTASFRATGVGHLLLAAAAFAVRFPAPPGLRQRAPLGAVLSPGILPFALIGFAYVGVESALTIFAVPYAQGALALPASRGLAAISAFWLGLLVGRLALLGVRRQAHAGFLLGAGLAGAAALAVGVAAGSLRVELVFASVGATLGFVFPLVIALVGERFPEARGTAMGLVAGAAALGGFAVPWLHGALGDTLGIDRSMGALVLWALLIAGAGWRAGRRHSA
jgi:MFS family permease